MSHSDKEQAVAESWPSDLAWLRGALGASEGEMRELLGCSRSALARWLEGEEPKKLETLLGLRRIRLALEGALPASRWKRIRLVWDLQEGGASLFEELQSLRKSPGSPRGVERAARALSARLLGMELQALRPAGERDDEA